MADGTSGRGRPEREYRFFTAEGEVSLEAFLEAVARRGEAAVVTEEQPAYRLTKKGRRALRAAS